MDVLTHRLVIIESRLWDQDGRPVLSASIWIHRSRFQKLNVRPFLTNSPCPEGSFAGVMTQMAALPVGVFLAARILRGKKLWDPAVRPCKQYFWRK
jgi:hypothetical protein